jgi:FkbM family methyltransferase
LGEKGIGEVMNDNTFPAMLSRLAKRFTPATIIDVGGSDGRWSRMAREVWPTAKLLLFEPNPVFKVALAEMEREGAHVVRALACASASGETTVRMDFEKPYQGVYELDDLMHSGSGETATASLATIDHEVTWRNLPGPYLVKLDTHGREHEILAGATQTLRSAGALVIEVYTWSQGPNSMRAAELIPCIEMAHGFLPSDMCEPLRRPLDQRIVQLDMLFEPRTAENMNTPNLW